MSTSGYYAWCRRSESAHAQRDRQLRVLVRASFDASKQRYGSPRIHEDLLEQKVRVSRKRVIRLMQEDGLQARARKRFKCTTMSDHDQPVAANLLDRQFTADGPNRRWVGDTTEFVIGESGKLYLAAILDLFSRFIVGWAVSAVNDRHLTLKALGMALKRRCPEAGLLHHSDQGCTYASEDYQRMLDANGITCSMSRRGNCYDNAVMEAFFSSVKSETADRFASCGEAKMELFDYIEVFYNQRRRHSTLGQISPAEFERRKNEEGVDPMENRTRTRFPTGSTPIVSFIERRKDHEDRSTQRHRPLNRIRPIARRRHLHRLRPGKGWTQARGACDARRIAAYLEAAGAIARSYRLCAHRPWRNGSGVRMARKGGRGAGLADGAAQRRAALRHRAVGSAFCRPSRPRRASTIDGCLRRRGLSTRAQS